MSRNYTKLHTQREKDCIQWRTTILAASICPLLWSLVFSHCLRTSYTEAKNRMNFTIWEKLMHNMKGRKEKKKEKERWCLLPWHISNHHPIPFFIFIGQDMIFIRVNSISTWAYFKELIKLECSLALVIRSYLYGATFWWYRVTLKAWISFQKKKKKKAWILCTYKEWWWGTYGQ